MSDLKLEWTDEVTISFDSTINMGIGFDWETLEITREQTTTCRGDFMIFASGCKREWSVYGGDLGYLLFQEFKTRDDACDWVQDYHIECLIEIKDKEIAQLKADKAELVEALVQISEYNSMIRLHISSANTHDKEHVMHYVERVGSWCTQSLRSKE